jgi:hypothetical protein
MLDNRYKEDVNNDNIDYLNETLGLSLPQTERTIED